MREALKVRVEGKDENGNWTASNKATGEPITAETSRELAEKLWDALEFPPTMRPWMHEDEFCEGCLRGFFLQMLAMTLEDDGMTLAELYPEIVANADDPEEPPRLIAFMAKMNGPSSLLAFPGTIVAGIDEDGWDVRKDGVRLAGTDLENAVAAWEYNRSLDDEPVSPAPWDHESISDEAKRMNIVTRFLAAEYLGNYGLAGGDITGSSYLEATGVLQ